MTVVDDEVVVNEPVSEALAGCCADVARRGLFTDQFIFESPFTKSGKAHGDLADQCKRKTILRTAKAFPFVKSRLPIIEKKEVRIVPGPHGTRHTRHTRHARAEFIRGADHFGADRDGD